jgi:hypothetical protein
MGSISLNLSEVDNILGYDDITLMSIIAIITGVILLLLIAFICLLVFRNQSQISYSEKNLIYKFVSTLPVFIRSLFFYLAVKSYVDTLDNFAVTVSKTPIQYLAFIMSIIGIMLMIVVIYLTANFYTLVIPNKVIPWAETSPQP